MNDDLRNQGVNQEETLEEREELVPQKKVLSIRVPVEVLQVLRARAEQKGRSYTSLAIEAIEQYLRREKQDG